MIHTSEHIQAIGSYHKFNVNLGILIIDSLTYEGRLNVPGETKLIKPLQGDIFRCDSGEATIRTREVISGYQGLSRMRNIITEPVPPPEVFTMLPGGKRTQPLYCFKTKTINTGVYTPLDNVFTAKLSGRFYVVWLWSSNPTQFHIQFLSASGAVIGDAVRMGNDPSGAGIVNDTSSLPGSMYQAAPTAFNGSNYGFEVRQMSGAALDLTIAFGVIE